MTIFPINWVRAPIGSLCDLKNGRAFKPAEWSQDGLPIVRIQNLNKASAPFNRFNGTYDHKHYLKGGELLFAWSGTPGTSFGAHVWRGGEALLNQHIFRVDFDDALLDRRFFRHAINQKLTELIGVAHGGAGLQHVTKGVFEGTEVALPPRTEQKRIADKLDAVLTRVDAVNTRLARVAPLLKRFRQSVLAAATSGRLTEDWRTGKAESDFSGAIDELMQVLGVKKTQGTLKPTAIRTAPYLYETRSLSNLGQVSGGLTKNGTRNAMPLSRPYLRVANVYANELRLSDVSEIGLTAAELQKTRLLLGDLLLVEGNGSLDQIGRVAMWDGSIEDCSHQNHLIRWRAGDQVISKFVLYYLLSPLGRAQIEEVAKSTSGLHTLSVSKVAALSLKVPDLQEQTEIVRRIETLFAFADRLEARLQTAQTATERLTPSLLAKAFCGELVPQDPNDEPASELLKRLAEQGPTSKTTRQVRKVKSK
jgi:type I restriction enzyme S subunit